MKDLMPSRPSDIYRLYVEQGAILDDVAQAYALSQLDTLWESLKANILSPSPNHAAGVYLWGEVGRGKTMLMDIFFNSLPPAMAFRQHFYHFMSDLHRTLNTTFGQANPLKKIAKEMAKKSRVICLDEFFIADVADAMLLGNLLPSLFEEGVCVVTTSNTPISKLFDSLLDRSRFQATIELMESVLSDVPLTGILDHRYRLPQSHSVFLTDIDAFQNSLKDQFPSESIVEKNITVNHRPLHVFAESDQALWCDFNALCVLPRSTSDYIELVKRYQSIFVSDIPVLGGEPYEHIKARGTEDGAVGSGQTGERLVRLGINDNAVRRFIGFVDEAYDQRIKVIFQAHVKLEDLYTSGSLLFEFQRTNSRIIEMHTDAYLRSIQ